jgi:uncharacterized membrane protein
MLGLDIILLIIRWAHALAAVTWIGGSLFLLFAGRPALRSADTGGVVGRALAAEFRPIVATAIGVLIVSGVILAVSRLTSDAASLGYVGVLIAKIALAVYAFAIVWLLPRRRSGGAVVAGEPATPAVWRRARAGLTGPTMLTVAGVIVIGLADVLGWLFERSLAD